MSVISQLNKNVTNPLGSDRITGNGVRGTNQQRVQGESKNNREQGLLFRVQEFNCSKIQTSIYMVLIYAHPATSCPSPLGNCLTAE